MSDIYLFDSGLWKIFRELGNEIINQHHEVGKLNNVNRMLACYDSCEREIEVLFAG